MPNAEKPEYNLQPILEELIHPAPIAATESARYMLPALKEAIVAVARSAWKHNKTDPLEVFGETLKKRVRK